MTWTEPRPSLARIPFSDSSTGGMSRSGSLSVWLSTTSVTAPCAASGARKSLCTAASAYFCGSSTQTRTSTRPTIRCTMSRLAALVESKSGRSRSISPVSSSARPSTGVAWCRLRTSSQSSSGSLPSAPQTPARGSVVVGRRTAAVAISAPLTALNRDDLPLPVAPKNPTTVWSADRERRDAARSSSRSTSSSTSSGRTPSASSRASLRASSLPSSCEDTRALPWRLMQRPQDGSARPPGLPARRGPGALQAAGQGTCAARPAAAAGTADGGPPAPFWPAGGPRPHRRPLPAVSGPQRRCRRPRQLPGR